LTKLILIEKKKLILFYLELHHHHQLLVIHYVFVFSLPIQMKKFLMIILIC